MADTTAPAPRYFWCDDNGCDYLIVATDREHAERLLRDAGIDFPMGEHGETDADAPEWRELSTETARAKNIAVEADQPYTMPDGTAARILNTGSLPLTSFGIGEWFSSEY